MLALANMRITFLKNIFHFRKKGDVFKFLVVSGFVIALWVFSFVLFLKGFNFLNGFPGIGELVGDRMLYIVLGVIFFMLIISTAIVSYSTHYKSEELPFLFAMPVENNSIFIYKSLHAVFLSSWASIFLISPLVAAYGVTRQLGAAFYLVSAVCFQMQVVISGMAGIAIVMLIVRQIRGRTAWLMSSASVLIILIVTFLIFHSRKGFDKSDETILVTLNQLLYHTRIFLFPLLPSYWLSEGLISFTKHEMGQVLFYCLLLLSTASVSVIFTESFVGRAYYDSWLRSRDACKAGRNAFVKKVDLITLVLRFIPKNLLSFVIKDIKTFLRDPQQWSQALIFLGLLMVYLLNLRRMPYNIEAIFWKKLIIFLNITSIITILAMLSTRFAFPLISFEGKRFWITLLSPVSLRQLVMEKFWVTGTGLFLMGEILIITLNVMLNTTICVFIATSVVVAVVSFALAGLSIGIGAMFPDFREDNFARISSGFGGTLLLVFNLVYICVVLVFSTVPVFIVKETSVFFRPSLFLAGIGVVLISLFCAVFPVYLGIKSLTRRDY